MSAWPKATADLFTDAAGIAAYIDGQELAASVAEVDYRRELAELQADPDMRGAVVEALSEQRGAVTAWLDALVHLGAARWEYMCTALASDHGSWSNGPCPSHPSRRRLVITGPVEDDPHA